MGALLPFTHWPDAVVLELALRHVVADAIARDMGERLRFADVACARADHDREFDLPVGLFRVLRDDDVVVRPDDAGGGLVEQQGLLGDRHAGLGRVVGIIEADGDEIADLAEARADPGRSAHRRQGLRLDFGEPRKSARSEHVGVDIRHHVAQIPQFSILVDQGRLLLARPAISRQFHKPSQSKAAHGPGIVIPPGRAAANAALPNAGGVGPSMLDGSLCRILSISARAGHRAPRYG